MAKQPDPIPPEGTPLPLTEGYLTAKEAAEQMGLSVETVRAMCNDGSLSGAVRKQSRWYVPLSTVEAWGQRQPEEPPSFKGGMAPTPEVVPAPFQKEPGPPARWQRFRYNPWVFYPIAVISALVVLGGVFFGLIQAGAVFGSFFGQVKEWGLVQEFPPEREGETLIVIAEFYHSEDVTDIEAHNEIRHAIEAAAKDVGESSLRVAVSSVSIAADDQERARKLGEKYKASIVIWGADTGVRIAVNFLNLKHPDFDAAQARISESQRTQIASPSAYASFVTRDLPGQLSFLALFAMGQEHYVRGTFEDSAWAVEKGIAALESSSESPTGLAAAYFLLGWLYGTLNDSNTSIDRYTKAIELEPNLVSAYNNRGDQLADIDNNKAALADFDKAIELQPDDAGAYLNRGAVRYELGDLPGAISDSNKVIELRPDLIEAYLNRGGALLRQGELSDAFSDITRVIDARPAYAEAYTDRGLVRLEQGDPTGAVSDFDKAIEVGPDFLAYYHRGRVRADQGNLVDALADFDKAIEGWPDSVAYFNRGYVLGLLGNLPGAIADYDKAIELQPRLVEAYVNRGLARIHQGNISIAIQDYDKAIELDPQFTAAYYNRGAAHYDQNMLDAAIQDLNKAIELGPQNAGSYYMRGTARSDVGDLDGAIHDYDKAIELRPEVAAYYYNRGLAYAKKGNLTAGIKDFDKTIELDPMDADAYYNRGVAREAHGEQSDAVADLRRYLELVPDASDREQVELWIAEVEQELAKP